MSTAIPRYWQNRIDDFRDNLKWALAEGDTQALLAHFTRCQALHNSCPDEYRQAVKVALLDTLWQVLATVSFSLPPSDKQPPVGD
jgi:hypothetical protein